MGILSNFPWMRGARPDVPDESAPVEVRPACAGEIAPALDRVATCADGRLDESHAQGLRDVARAHQGDLGGPWVATQGHRLLSAALPVVSPGRTMLVFACTHAPSPVHVIACRRLLDAVCSRAADQGVQLAQALLEPADLAGLDIFQQAGFKRLAELIYLQGGASRGLKEGPLPQGMCWRSYAPESHALFARAVLASYRDSLDCPGLNGLRSIEDILRGHRATGEFDADKWFVLVKDDHGQAVPAGVLLLNRVPWAGMTELVYLGLAPEFRGRGLADVLLRRALAAVAGSDCGRLSLAVDAANERALKLYWRHGLQSVGRKVALLRVLFSTGGPHAR